MFLAIDIGNSSIKFGLFEDGTISRRFSIPTKENLSLNKLTAKWEHFIGSRNVKVDSVMVASVVPEANIHISAFCKTIFTVEPVFIDSSMLDDMESSYEPPTSTGHDRLINVYAALKKYGSPVIICSFGTATTIDAANDQGKYLGGIIAPGMLTMSESLHAKASQLPNIDIRPARRVIGNSTESSILSGIYFGQAGLAEKLIERIADELSPNSTDKRPVVVATGGLANMLFPAISGIDHLDENLTLEGLYFLSQRGKDNSAKHSNI